MTACPQDSRIVDYEHTDFRDFWSTPTRQLLHREELRLLRDLLCPTEGWFLDLGAGYGRLAAAYNTTRGRFVLADYSMKHLRLAAEAIADPNVAFVAADACNLPFRDGVFSGGMAIRLAHHIPELRSLLGEWARVLRPGSRSVVTFMNRRSLLRILRFPRASMRRDHALIAPTQYGTHPAYFAEQTRLSGFHVARRAGVGFVHQLARSLPQLDGAMRLSSSVSRLLSWSERLADGFLGSRDLSLMQFYLLLRLGEALPVRSGGPVESLASILACPGCRAGGMTLTADQVRCPSCGASYPIRDGVVDLRVHLS